MPVRYTREKWGGSAKQKKMTVRYTREKGGGSAGKKKAGEIHEGEMGGGRNPWEEQEKNMPVTYTRGNKKWGGA